MGLRTLCWALGSFPVGAAWSQAHPLVDDYWRSKEVDFAAIETPSYVVASWSDQATGVVRRDGRSLALVRGWEQVDRITAYGGWYRAAAPTAMPKTAAMTASTYRTRTPRRRRGGRAKPGQA